MGEESGSVLGCKRSVGDVVEVCKSVWGECGGCVKVGKSVLECGEVWGCGGAHTFFYTFFTSLPTPSPDTYFHTYSTPPPHSPDQSRC